MKYKDKKKVLVIGSLNVDMVTNVDHTPVAGETILGDKLDLIPGGKGANQACAAGRLGADVTMFGALGDDQYAMISKKSLIDSGINVSCLIKKKHTGTGVALITVDKEGDNSIVVIPGANAKLSMEDIDRNIGLIEQSDIVVFQLEIPVETVLYAARKAKELNKLVILDPAPAPPEFPMELYRYVDVIKPNETELGILAKTENVLENLYEATELLKDYGVKHVIVTLGNKGVYVNSFSQGIEQIPSYEVQVVDTTAAGDSFTASLALMLAEGKELMEAVRYANLVAAIVVTRKGAQSSIPSVDEVREYEGKLNVVRNI